MEGNLVIVESPAKAGTIKKFLGDDFKVLSSRGHIRDLQENNLSIDIENGFKPDYIVPAEKKKLVSELKSAAQAAHTVWLASDEDREGEAISWHLFETLGLKKENTRRIVFHEITKNAILKAIETPRDINLDLVNAQQARRVLDRIVGYKLSPVLWRKIQRGLSAGRVQSVALRLVVDREKEIIGFKSSPYYKVEGIFNAAGVKVKGTLDTRFDSLEQARAFLEDSIGANYKVAAADKKQGSRSPAAPFTTSTLQQEASRKLRYPVSLTMRLAQSLYERGLITYMRTDSTNLSSLAIGTSKKYICENYGEQYSHTRQYKTRSKGAQEAHEAIRPTYIENTSIEGSAQEKKLYELIWKRTIASQMEDAKVLNTSVKVASDKRSEMFGFQATEILFDGFLKVYMESSEDDAAEEGNAVLPELHVGDSVVEKGLSAECKVTQPPYRYSEASLVKKREELGIGRPSTYAPTISTLTTARGYIIKGDKEGSKVAVTNLSLKGSTISQSVKNESIGAEKGKLMPQEIGIIVSDYLVENFPQIMDYDFTANVEKEFDEIAEGKREWNEVIAEFFSPFQTKVSAVSSDGQFGGHVERLLGTDPADGRNIYAKFGQYGPYVQKGENDDADRQFASLGRGQLIESITLAEAVSLLQLPRSIGEYEGIEIKAFKGRFGPYLKYGERNISIPRGEDPLRISLERCIELISESTSNSQSSNIAEFTDEDIVIVNGRYGPYIKHAGSNFKIPKGTDATTLSLEDCKKIIAESEPTNRQKRTGRKRNG